MPSPSQVPQPGNAYDCKPPPRDHRVAAYVDILAQLDASYDRCALRPAHVFARGLVQGCRRLAA